MKNSFSLSILILASSIIFYSCSNNDDSGEGDDTPNETSLITDTSVFLSLDLDAQALYPLHFVEDAESATEDITDAQELLGSDGAVMVDIKDDYLYVNDFSGETFKKLEVDSNGILNEVGSLPNLGTNGSPLYDFLDDSTILLTSAQRAPEDGVVSYQVIDVDEMTLTSEGTFPLPIEADDSLDFSYSYANEYIYFEGNIYIPFVEANSLDACIYDEAYVAIYDASTFQHVKTITTTNTASLCSGFNVSYGIDEAGDLYLGSSNTSSWANNETVPSGIVRIKSGETDFDTDFFVDITELTGYHSLGMLYVANGLAIVQTFNSDIWDTSDYYVEYYLVDVNANTATKLDIPASRGGYYGTRRSLALLANGNAAIMTNSESGSALYIYDVSTGTVIEGTTYNGAEAVVGLKAF